MSAEARLKELGLTLPPPPKPGGIYKPVVIVNNLCYVSGHGPWNNEGKFLTGRVGDEIDQQAGYEAAKQCALVILTTLKTQLGSLDRIKRVIKTLGMVNAAPDFKNHPAVINGFSEVFAQVFGEENGIGARSAVGMGSLPGNISVEVEIILELHA